MNDKEPTTDIELRQLALDIITGKAFCDRQIPEHEKAVMSIFMPLLFLAADKEQSERVVKKIGTRGMVYEYMDAAFPMGVNGLPMFGSCRIMSHETGERFWPILREVEQDYLAITNPEAAAKPHRRTFFEKVKQFFGFFRRRAKV